MFFDIEKEKDRNFQEEINAAVSAGDMEMAALLEQKRNAKIDAGYGNGAQKTFSYTNDNGSHLQNEYAVTPTNGSGGGAGGAGGGYGGTSPLWTSKYQGQIDALTKSLLNREAFSYNPMTDPLYQNYLDQYTRAGNLAMQDTLGQVSARTGGLASSYATGAAQGAYNNYMQQAADKVPDLYKLAYSMYQDQGDTMMNNIGLLQGLDNTQYGRYQDALSQYNTDRNFNYGVGRDAVSDARYTDETAYARGRDAIADKRYEEETAYEREQDALSASRKSSGSGSGGGVSNVSNNNSDLGIVDTMLSMGSEREAFEYLVGLGLTEGKTEAIMGYYQDAVGKENANRYGYGYSKVQETIANIEESLYNQTFTPDDYIERVKSVISTALKNGMITEEGARQLLQSLGATDF